MNSAASSHRPKNVRSSSTSETVWKVAMRPIAVLLLLFLSAAHAQEPSAPVPPPPPMAAPSASEPTAPEQAPPPPENGAEVIEPQVTIVRRGEDVIEEYRVGGLLYMIKIIPAKGYPYFLVDTDGDGNLETRRNELSNPSIPQWVLFRW
jgi:hypothetical protein